jgi:hypothetical protein
MVNDTLYILARRPLFFMGTKGAIMYAPRVSITNSAIWEIEWPFKLNSHIDILQWAGNHYIHS